MEQTPPQGGELQDTQAPHVPPPEQTPHDQPPPQASESHDERIIRQGIEQAHQAGTDIDDRTARYIASQLHEGQASALYSLASTGTIAESLQDELNRNLDHQTSQVQTWITWLGAYCLNREYKGPIPGWAASAAAIDQTEEEERARTELMARLSAAATTTLGEIAVVVTTEQASEDAEETDSFPWHDAARWSPNNPDDDQARTRLEALFTEPPDQELGTTQHMGWFGLLTQDGLSGGFILSRNSYGHRRVWATDSDDRLARHWEQLQSEYDAFMRATRAEQTLTRAPATQADNSEQLGHDHRNRTDTDHPHLNSRTEDTGHSAREDHAAEQTTSGHSPEIWVGSLSDYNDGHLHGTWLDATLDPDDLHLAIQFILRTGHDSSAEEWAIMDYDDFCGLNLGEYEPLETISRIANGIAEHGEAFAKWVEYVGERSEELLSDERFQDHYLGYFENTEAYVENLLEETAAYEFEEFVPEWLKPYVKIDVELLARDSEIELYVAEAEDGGVFVFDTRG